MKAPYSAVLRQGQDAVRDSVRKSAPLGEHPGESRQFLPPAMPDLLELPIHALRFSGEIQRRDSDAGRVGSPGKPIESQGTGACPGRHRCPCFAIIGKRQITHFPLVYSDDCQTVAGISNCDHRDRINIPERESAVRLSTRFASGTLGCHGNSSSTPGSGSCRGLPIR